MSCVDNVDIKSGHWMWCSGLHMLVNELVSAILEVLERLGATAQMRLYALPMPSFPILEPTSKCMHVITKPQTSTSVQMRQ